MVTNAELYTRALSELESSNGDILATAIVTFDGLIMASTTSDEISKETFAGYTTSKREALEELSKEAIDMLLFESAK